MQSVTMWFGHSCRSLNKLNQDVDIIYIGTINTSHFALAQQAIAAGKQCLVEKPACLTALDWTTLSVAAKEKKVFLMEGMRVYLTTFAARADSCSVVDTFLAVVIRIRQEVVEGEGYRGN